MAGEALRFCSPINRQTIYEGDYYLSKKKNNDYGTGIPKYEMESLARALFPTIQAYYETEKGQREFAEWKAKQDAKKNKQSK